MTAFPCDANDPSSQRAAHGAAVAIDRRATGRVAPGSADIALSKLPARSDDDAVLNLDPLQLRVIRLGAAAAAVLGMPTARDAVAARHELWTAALLVHEIGSNPLWRAGRPRRAVFVATALAAARRLTDAALARLAAAPRDES